MLSDSSAVTAEHRSQERSTLPSGAERQYVAQDRSFKSTCTLRTNRNKMRTWWFTSTSSTRHHVGVSYSKERSDEIVDVNIPNRRQLRGRKRQETVKQLTQQSTVAQLHTEKLANMSVPEVKAGNTTVCQTLAMLNQAVYETRQLQCLHPHPVVKI